MCEDRRFYRHLWIGYAVQEIKWYTRALVVNKNPVSLFEFQADKRGKILKKFRLIDHKCKRSKTLCQIVSIVINLSMFYATKTMEQWGPNHENVTLWQGHYNLL